MAVPLDARLGALHRWLGLATIVLFLATGQIMEQQNLDALPLDSWLRLLFRSRHIYLLLGGLVNLSIGLRFALPPRGGACAAALVGSTPTPHSAVCRSTASRPGASSGRRGPP